jgi:mannose-6-phosphate isomerase-like protein (cupin superfamily)
MEQSRQLGQAPAISEALHFDGFLGMGLTLGTQRRGFPSASSRLRIHLSAAVLRLRFECENLGMSSPLPEIITIKGESSIDCGYDNHPIATTNDHVVRIATMTEPYHWHFHPNSDETFLVIEGRLAIEFESGSVELGPGQLLTIPRGVHHRTRPVGTRSVNLTFELAQSETIAV